MERVPPDPQKIEEAFAEIERALQRLEHWETSAIYSLPADDVVRAIRTLAEVVLQYIAFPDLLIRMDPRVEAFGPIPREAIAGKATTPSVHDFRTGG